MSNELTKEQRQAEGLIDLDAWVMVTPFGPMRHRDSGESYQARNARLAYERQQAHENRME